ERINNINEQINNMTERINNMNVLIERINNMNVLIATPGRLLQHMDETYGFDAHMDETYGFDAGNLQARLASRFVVLLVLDEADRILDLGFSATLNNSPSPSPLKTPITSELLVLDEADRILDLGFSATLNNIVANLPKTRQTCLFSATLTKSVRDLARLSMAKAPEYLS
ncbi:hypothetical protein T484DRAFT_1810188, partial [Baffinella frigidus]